MDELVTRLADVPLYLLYPLMAALAAIENIFPPLPTDVVVAFGSFLAARGTGTAVAAFLSTWLGNLLGAFFMYMMGRRYGPRIFATRLERFTGVDSRVRMEKLYARYGVVALFVSRFLPGVRAVVPPFAGALHLGPIRVMASIGAASAIWYGFLTVLAFKAGEDWERLKALVLDSSLVLAIAATSLTIIALIVWLVRRRRPPPPGIEGSDLP
jgi:membrane protein DedA with SNARE-associated domain